ncbi:hypothetical protein E4U53_006694 [Claviceps sorghi]|nr:hypothetical protein E4U53_006694 [Claviceps sorghi]
MNFPITFAADPNTDFWKQPPTHDAFSAPHRPHSKGSSLDFISATLTFVATYTHQFDQAGILLTFTRGSDRKWIKSGVEFFNNVPRLSTVCTDNYSDWSVSDAPNGDAIRSGCRPVTITVERVDEELGRSLWIYHVDGSKRTPLRQVTWPFGTAGDGWELEVSAAIARPYKDTQDKLEATFPSFDVEWRK